MLPFAQNSEPDSEASDKSHSRDRRYAELIPYTATQPQDVLRAWAESVRRSNHITAATQGPEWTKFRCARHNNGVLALLRERKNGRITDVTPLLREGFTLRFSKVGKTSFKGYRLFGSSILFEAHYDELIESIFNDRNSDFFRINVPEFDPINDYISAQEGKNRRWFVFRPKEVPAYIYWIDMSTGSSAYWSKFKKKHRYNLQRELSILYKSGPVDFIPINTKKDLKLFSTIGLKIAHNSWQRQIAGEQASAVTPERIEEALSDLTDRNMLRSYLLLLNSEPVAYCTGFQHEELFWLYETAYDDKFAALSVGKCILQLVIKDLFQFNTPRYFSFGSGGSNYDYKQWFSTHSCVEKQFFIMRNTVANRTKIAAYREAEGAAAGLRRIGSHSRSLLAPLRPASGLSRRQASN